MKKCSFSIVCFVVTLLVACGNNASVKSASKADSKTGTKAAVTPAADHLSRGEGIVGEWNLALEAYDDNGNHRLDEAEQKKGIVNHYYYRFNPDGTCLIHTMRFKGLYEIKEQNGKQMLYTYLDEEGKKTPENTYEIVSMSKDELVLLWETTFWVFKTV